MEANRKLIGRVVEILVEGYSKRAVKSQDAEQSRGQETSTEWSDQLVGRTRTDRIVVFTASPEQIGRFVRVRITGATALTLHGEMVDDYEQSSRVDVVPLAVPTI